jgi:hypothetical protein
VAAGEVLACAGGEHATDFVGRWKGIHGASAFYCHGSAVLQSSEWWARVPCRGTAASCETIGTG